MCTLLLLFGFAGVRFSTHRIVFMKLLLIQKNSKSYMSFPSENNFFPKKILHGKIILQYHVTQYQALIFFCGNSTDFYNYLRRF